jgi:hypothetical protein
VCQLKLETVGYDGEEFRALMIAGAGTDDAVEAAQDVADRRTTVRPATAP